MRQMEINESAIWSLREWTPISSNYEDRSAAPVPPTNNVRITDSRTDAQNLGQVKCEYSKPSASVYASEDDSEEISATSGVGQAQDLVSQRPTFATVFPELANSLDPSRFISLPRETTHLISGKWLLAELTPSSGPLCVRLSNLALTLSSDLTINYGELEQGLEEQQSFSRCWVRVQYCKDVVTTARDTACVNLGKLWC